MMSSSSCAWLCKQHACRTCGRLERSFCLCLGNEGCQLCVCHSAAPACHLHMGKRPAHAHRLQRCRAISDRTSRAGRAQLPMYLAGQLAACFV